MYQFHNIMDVIHGRNVWEDIGTFTKREGLPPGWGDITPVFNRILDEGPPPKLIVEVGSWLGRSALAMHKVLEERGMGAPIICVDTWLGSPEMWVNKHHVDRWPPLKMHMGRPQCYFDFILNVKANGAHTRIIPLSMDSLAASVAMDFWHIDPSHVFIDGSHYDLAVRADLNAWWRSNRVLFGDDWAEEEGWPAIKRQVGKFFVEHNKNIRVDDRYWWVMP